MIQSYLFEFWEEFKTRSPLLEAIGTPRWLRASANTGVEIHVFADAPERTYSAASYMRVSVPGVSCTAQVIMAKTKVAPVKTLSTPRLRLCCAPLGENLVKQVLLNSKLIDIPTFTWVNSQV